VGTGIGQRERHHDDHGEDAQRLSQRYVIRPRAIAFAEERHFGGAARHAGEEGSGAIDPCRVAEDPAGARAERYGEKPGDEQQRPVGNHLARHHRREIETERSADHNLAEFAAAARRAQAGAREIAARHRRQRSDHPWQRQP
jgi:hypothetical protein